MLGMDSRMAVQLLEWIKVADIEEEGHTRQEKGFFYLFHVRLKKGKDC